jgi:hypothetical protein
MKDHIDYAHLSHSERFAIAAKLWSELDPSEKAAFVNAAEKWAVMNDSQKAAFDRMLADPKALEAVEATLAKPKKVASK